MLFLQLTNIQVFLNHSKDDKRIASRHHNLPENRAGGGKNITTPQSWRGLKSPLIYRPYH